jgi:hypothetical protein
MRCKSLSKFFVGLIQGTFPPGHVCKGIDFEQLDGPDKKNGSIGFFTFKFYGSFSFFEPFGARLVSMIAKIANMTQKFFPTQNKDCVSKSRIRH